MVVPGVSSIGRSTLAAVFSLAACSVALGALPTLAAGAEPSSPADQLIVSFESDVSRGKAREIVRDAGARSLARLSLINGAVVDVGDASERTSTLRELRLADGVRYVERDQEVRALGAPNDPMFPQLWGMTKIEAPAAWDIYSGGSTLVAVTDTGIDTSHPDLDGNLWVNPREVAGNGVDDDANGVVDDVNGANFSAGANTGNPTDGHGHGTHVAGTIAAEAGNGIGVAGVNPKAKILSVKFLGDDGRGNTSDAVRAIDYSRAMGAKVINASWGGGGYSKALEEAIAKAGSQSNTLFVAAAGNSGVNTDSQPHFPSSYELDNVVSVAATGESDGLTSFSNFGSCSVDLAAPGLGILSTVPGGSYRSFSGTSMAAPHVAGVASLIAARTPGIGQQEIKARLMESVDKPAPLAGKVVTGGRLNARNALASTAATPPVGCPPKPKPPVNSAKPVITGTPKVGEVLTVSQGTWDNSPTGITRAWWECQTPRGQFCQPLPGAGGLTYLPLSASLGKYLFVIEEARNAAGRETVASNGVGPVTDAPPLPPPPPPPPLVRELKLSGSDQRNVVRTGRLSASVISTVPNTTARLRYRVDVGRKAIASAPATQVSVGTESRMVTTRMSSDMRVKVKEALKRDRDVILTITATGQDAGGGFDKDQIIRLRIRS